MSSNIKDDTGIDVGNNEGTQEDKNQAKTKDTCKKAAMATCLGWKDLEEAIHMVEDISVFMGRRFNQLNKVQSLELLGYDV